MTSEVTMRPRRFLRSALHQIHMTPDISSPQIPPRVLNTRPACVIGVQGRDLLCPKGWCYVQATSNAYLLFARWAEVLRCQCQEALKERGEKSGDGGAARGGGEGEDNVDMSVGEPEEFYCLLVKVLAIKRPEWDQKLATHLIANCIAGHAKPGGRRKRKAGFVSWGGSSAKNPRVCNGGKCKTRENQKAGSKTRTCGACWCNICTGGRGVERALPLCKTCSEHEAAHVTAQGSPMPDERSGGWTGLTLRRRDCLLTVFYFYFCVARPFCRRCWDTLMLIPDMFR